jgi:hypothetical protein
MRKAILYILAAATALWAISGATVPNTFSANTLARAATMNTNFDSVEVAIDRVADTLNLSVPRWNTFKDTTIDTVYFRYADIDTLGGAPFAPSMAVGYIGGDTADFDTVFAGFLSTPLVSFTSMGGLSANITAVTVDTLTGGDLGVDSVTCTKVNSGQGWTEVYLQDQNTRTTDGPTFATINTGNGANELFPMNQAVRTTDAPTFSGAIFTGNVSVPSANITVGDGTANRTLSVVGSSDAEPRGIVVENIINSTSSPLLYFRKARGSGGVRAQTLSGDGLGVIAFQGYDDVGYSVNHPCIVGANAVGDFANGVNYGTKFGVWVNKQNDGYSLYKHTSFDSEGDLQVLGGDVDIQSGGVKINSGTRSYTIGGSGASLSVTSGTGGADVNIFNSSGTSSNSTTIKMYGVGTDGDVATRTTLNAGWVASRNRMELFADASNTQTPSLAIFTKSNTNQLLLDTVGNISASGSLTVGSLTTDTLAGITTIMGSWYKDTSFACTLGIPGAITAVTLGTQDTIGTCRIIKIGSSYTMTFNDFDVIAYCNSSCTGYYETSALPLSYAPTGDFDGLISYATLRYYAHFNYIASTRKIRIVLDGGAGSGFRFRNNTIAYTR